MQTPSPSLSRAPLTFTGLSLSRTTDGLLVTFTGECDVLLQDALDGVLTAVHDAGLPVEVDLGDVTFFGAWGVHALLALRAAAPGAELTVHDASPLVHLALDACAVTLPGTAGAAHALRSLGGQR
ncbi:STAS domain-containing protein [Cellulomonas cellasea]|uniref:Anti-anti-sigma regulatory factor n=1 Tax=Cellulomonas cellasea TaxID=43670 RepID=A0A7W4UJW7_9CELL|nr:STAS domain-containing protein [Cellulomonas cellasea]MBB2925512.1 anti-anti-sigma regulatory factor [Cellulomonas cellasea]